MLTESDHEAKCRRYRSQLREMQVFTSIMNAIGLLSALLTSEAIKITINEITSHASLALTYWFVTIFVGIVFGVAFIIIKARMHHLSKMIEMHRAACDVD